MYNNEIWKNNTLAFKPNATELNGLNNAKHISLNLSTTLKFENIELFGNQINYFSMKYYVL